MKKRYILVGLLASYLHAFPQSNPTSYKSRKLSHTDVQWLVSYYAQDNNHSAVTGGKGTERLSVFAQQFSLDKIRDSVMNFHFDAGIDVITSASTDNIDFVKSSASEVDQRMHVNLGYNRFLSDKRTSVGGGFYTSVESDYTSFGASLVAHQISRDGSGDLSVSMKAFFDDQRWGLLSDGAPQRLVYPFELRYKEWFDIYRRNSFNLEIGYYKIINRRMGLGFYPGIVYQAGLLSTPFHRVYFKDNTEKVENQPRHRLKVPLGLQLNSFVGSRVVVRLYYRFYWDDFGISAHTGSLEVPVKVSRALSLTPSIRIYGQSGANFFGPYMSLDASQPYYSADYDLSPFTSIKPGIGIRWAPYAAGQRTTFNALEVRYSHYRRSDGMTANTITLFINYDKMGKK